MSREGTVSGAAHAAVARGRHTGRPVHNLAGAPPAVETDPDGGLSQANSIVSHPTMPLLITAHEDKYINIYDINTG